MDWKRSPIRFMFLFSMSFFLKHWKRAIRWSCDKCSQYYCNKCYPTFASDYCPCLKHKMTLTFNPSFGGVYMNNFTCDMCFKEFQTTEGLWIDFDCNYSLCQNCQKEGNDIPKIIEDWESIYLNNTLNYYN